MPHSTTCDCANEVVGIGRVVSLHENVQCVEIFGSDNNDINQFKSLFRDPALRFDKVCRFSPSDDGELLIVVTFTQPSTIHAISLLCEDDRWCGKLKLYRDEIETDTSSIREKTPSQEVDVVEDPCGRVPHPLKIVKFRDVHSLLILIEDINVEILHIGLFGEISKYRRDAPKNVVYEARANPADHQAVNSLNMKSAKY